MSGDEETSLQELYTKAANAKRALTRAKKELQNALKALTEAASSQHFFEELVKTQKDYREKRKKVYAIYDAIYQYQQPSLRAHALAGYSVLLRGMKLVVDDRMCCNLHQ